MKVLKILFVTLAVLAGLLAVTGLLLPRNLQVQRSIWIAAAPEQVYGYVSGFSRFNEWSPWADLDPDARYTITGPPEGQGARMEWSSELPSVGSGSQEVVGAKPAREVSIRLVFDDQREALSEVRLEGVNAGSQVTWRFNMDLGRSPVTRWIGLIVDGSIGADYETGLDRLKVLVETDAVNAALAAQAAAAAAAADEAEVDAQVEKARETVP